MAEKFDSFLKEVDEDLKREQLRKLWDSYGLLIIGAVIAVLAGVWGYGYWQNSRNAAAELQGAHYEMASRLAREGKVDEAAAAFAKIAKEATPGYTGLAQIRIAGFHAKAGRTTEAVTAYDAVANDASIDQVLRGFAGVQAATLRLGTADYAEMERRLTPLTAETSPWRSAARETLGLAAFKAGKLDEARKLFDLLLVDRNAPPGLNERVQLMLSILTDAEAAKAPAAASEKNKDKSAAPPADPKK